ncbi:ATP-binding protein [Corynebacterium sp. Q4381]|uniref:ATP-binding protein n=1 Tax=Corynebacterium sp. Marseille-Q4381 TaxID=3121597 RepID=UPI002FE517BB
MPRTEIEADEFEDQPVIVITVHPMRDDPKLGKQMPCFVTSQGPRNGSYKRVLDGDQRLSSYEIFQLSSLFETDVAELATPPLAAVDDLERSAWVALLDSFVKSGSRLMYGTRNDTEALERLHVVDAEGKPTLAGLLALGTYPQQFYPQLFIDVAVHPMTEKSASEVRFLDRKQCDGPLPIAVETAIQTVMANLRTRAVERDSVMVDEPEIPEIAIREAVVNAVMHRDYNPQVQGRQVQIDIYPDRVEINNPGGLWGDRTVENLDENRSTTRNPALANLLSHLPSPGGSSRVAENQGSGIQRMKLGMQHQGLPQPLFTATISDFTVTLFRFGLLTPEIAAWLESVAPDATREEHIVLAIAHGLGAVSVRELKNNIGLDSNDAREVLNGLVDKHILAPAGETDSFTFQSTRTAGADEEISRLLADGVELSAREIAEALGITLGSLRPRLRKLIDAGEISPTAPPTSRNRRYRLAK